MYNVNVQRKCYVRRKVMYNVNEQHWMQLSPTLCLTPLTYDALLYCGVLNVMQKQKTHTHTHARAATQA
jgi:hypothetical protein